jgi:uncharacterized protein (DUF58 family)
MVTHELLVLFVVVAVVLVLALVLAIVIRAELTPSLQFALEEQHSTVAEATHVDAEPVLETHSLTNLLFTTDVLQALQVDPD